jgi:hypothetical protein
MTENDRKKLDQIWQVHQSANWPGELGSDEGQLMTLDTVIGGCLTYYMDEHGLDEARIEILRDCMAELDSLVSELPEVSREYFTRLQFLGRILLQEVL